MLLLQQAVLGDAFSGHALDELKLIAQGGFDESFDDFGVFGL